MCVYLYMCEYFHVVIQRYSYQKPGSTIICVQSALSYGYYAFIHPTQHAYFGIVTRLKDM